MSGDLTDSAVSQNLSLGSTSVWGGKSLKFFRKMKISGVSVAGGQCVLAEFELMTDLSMGRKINEIA